MSQMPADVQKRIRALPGNNTCCDCSNVNPQWASVSYGSLMCLECSGHHRSLGVHLSFVRSIAMDSWTEKQILAMEKSGGNQKLIDFFESKNIAKSMQIPQKYNTKQAAYYRDRLARWLEGKTEPPPDPGRYDPATGVSEAQGAEPLPGETTEEYNARQARLREAARERMRQKFGDGGLAGLGATGSVEYSGGGGFGGGGGGGEGLGGLVSGVGSFFKNNIIENEKLRSTVGSAVSNVGQVAGGAYSSLKQSERFGGATSAVGGAVGGILGRASEKLGMQSGQPEIKLDARYAGKSFAEQQEEFWNSQYVDLKKEAELKKEVSAPAISVPPLAEKMTRATSSNAVMSSPPVKSTSLPAKAQSFGGKTAKAADFGDDDWGDWDTDFGDKKTPAPAPAPVPATRSASAPNPETSVFESPSKPSADPNTNGTNGNAAHKPAAAPAPTPAPAPAPAPAPTKAAPTPAPEATSPAPKKVASKLAEADDFFADFGV